MKLMKSCIICAFNVLITTSWGCSAYQPSGREAADKQSGAKSATDANASIPNCTNGSNRGDGFGWDPLVTDTLGSHTCRAVGSFSNRYPYCTNGSKVSKGYGWDPYVTDPTGSHSCLVWTATIPPINVNAPGNLLFHFSHYGRELQENKAVLLNAATKKGATAQEKAVLIAMAMQETTLMRNEQRDAKKDGTDSANITMLNMNIDMPTRLGFQGNVEEQLGNPDNLDQVVGLYLKAMRTWGIRATLNFQRGGYTAFLDGQSYRADEYANAIATMYNEIANDLSLETDDRRIEIWVEGV